MCLGFYHHLFTSLKDRSKDKSKSTIFDIHPRHLFTSRLLKDQVKAFFVKAFSLPYLCGMPTPKQLYWKYFIAKYWCYSVRYDEEDNSTFLFRTKWQHFWDKAFRRNRFLSRVVGVPNVEK